MAEKEIKAFVIFEMLGRPAEHLKKTLTEFIEKLGKEPGIQIKDKKINEPKKIPEAKQEIYTTFAETEMELKDLPTLFNLIFSYMPSNIEIIEPEELKIKNFDLNVLINELARRLHQYDEIAKGLALERNFLVQRLQQLGIHPGIVQPSQQTAQQTSQQTAPAKKETEKKIGKKKKIQKKQKKK